MIFIFSIIFIFLHCAHAQKCMSFFIFCLVLYGLFSIQLHVEIEIFAVFQHA